MAARTLLYAGSYTHEAPIGIHVYDASDPHGALELLSCVEGLEHPSFLAAHPNQRYLYAVSETTGVDGGALVAFRIDSDDGSLHEIDRASSHGEAPCHVSVDTGGRHLYVANYVSGTIAAYTIAQDGRFENLLFTHQRTGSGPTSRQEGPHAHCIVPGLSGEDVYVADLGTDTVAHFRRDPAEGLRFESDLAMAPGSGPRHLALHPTEPVAFLLCELDSTLVTLALDSSTGRPTELGSRPMLPDDFVGDSIGAEVRVHPDGRHVYASNRGHDSIAVFGFRGTSEPLERLGHVDSGGRTPRNFAVHPSGRAMLVANQDSDVIVRFAIDDSGGTPRQRDVAAELSQPVCLTFVEVDR